MKKILATVLLVAMAMGLMACDQGTATPSPGTASPDPIATVDPTQSPDPTQTTDPSQEPDPTDSGDPTPADVDLTSSLEEIISYMYATANLDDDTRTWLTGSGTIFMEITADNLESMVGTTDVDYAEGVASEASITAQAFSIVLLRMNDGADIEATKTAIKENANPRKWICVGVEEDDVIVDSIDNLVILIMADNAAAYQEAFQTLAN